MGLKTDWIPKHISDKTVIRTLEFLSFFGRVPKSSRVFHLEDNERKWGNISEDHNIVRKGYIINQPALCDMYFGKESKFFNHIFDTSCLRADYNSCEAIALYNAIQYGKTLVSSRQENDENNIALQDITFPCVLNWLEEKGIVLNGYFGTSPRALEKLLKSIAAEAKLFYGDELRKKQLKCDIWQELERDYDCFILTGYNNQDDIMDMVHTMCIVPGKSGYTLLNCHEGKKKYKSISEPCINYGGDNKASKMISLIAIRW